MNIPDSNTPAPDPYEWLESIESEPSLSWVRERNARTEETFFDAAFEADRAQIYDIATRPDSIPFIERRGAHVYNFWQDADHVRGLWRRTTLDDYRKDEPAWEVLLDLDVLAAQENEDWVWRGCATLEPEHRLGLLNLSRGGSDSAVVREFDLEQKGFVEDGFFLPQAKGGAGWVDEDTLLVNSALDEVTTSGYPRLARLWKRNIPLQSAPVVFEGQREDVGVGGYYEPEKGFERFVFSRGLTFEDSRKWLQLPGGTLQELDVPLDARLTLKRDWLLVNLESDWELPHRTFAADSLLAISLSAFMKGERDFEVLFQPSPRRTLSSFSWTNTQLLLCVLDNLESRVFLLTPQEEGWKSEPLGGLPEAASIGAWPLDNSTENKSDDFLVSISGFLEPTTLWLHTIEDGLQRLKSAPSAFDASGLKVSRHEAISSDGERIPYFQIGPAHKGEPRPTILYGYGGFSISLLPHYLGATGRVWLEEGGVYIVANIRGGGEFGAAWHKGAMREGRRLAYDDFAAVARDLIARGVTTPAQLAARGGSNGGLLVGNMLTRAPELFGAIVCEVPLLDMKRYSHLLAGASWVSEFGDPDNPDDWEFLRHFSPYHNVEPGRAFPPVLLVTARHDDRVHPAHARKMAARLEEFGYRVHFYEPDDSGGHGAANKKQSARLTALSYAFLKRVLNNG